MRQTIVFGDGSSDSSLPGPPRLVLMSLSGQASSPHHRHRQSRLLSNIIVLRGNRYKNTTLYLPLATYRPRAALRPLPERRRHHRRTGRSQLVPEPRFKSRTRAHGKLSLPSEPPVDMAYSSTTAPPRPSRANTANLNDIFAAEPIQPPLARRLSTSGPLPPPRGRLLCRACRDTSPRQPRANLLLVGHAAAPPASRRRVSLALFSIPRSDPKLAPPTTPSISPTLLQFIHWRVHWTPQGMAATPSGERHLAPRAGKEPSGGHGDCQVLPRRSWRRLG